MLVLSRHAEESITIGDNITVTVLRIGPNTVKLGIEAPKSVLVMRSEVPVMEDRTEGHPMMLEVVRHCRHCHREMNVTKGIYEQNPFCAECLPERLQSQQAARKLIGWSASRNGYSNPIFEEPTA